MPRLSSAAMQPIFVGDVQGCADELDELLARAERSFGDEFEIYVVGDLINRGPANLRALERVRAFVEVGRGHYVLGNHEIGFLRVAFGLCGPEPGDSVQDVLMSREATEWVDWLRRRPLVVAGEIAGERFAVVHAAVHPHWSLAELTRQARRVELQLGAAQLEAAVELLSTPACGGPSPGSRQDVLARLTRCRSVRGEHWSSDLPKHPEEAWHVQWSRQRHDYGVVYGHWALQGLHVAAGLRGLDTGCVHHGHGGSVGRLTCWLPGWRRCTGSGLFGVPDDSFWHFPARRRYYE